MKHRLKSFSQTNTINKANTILLDLENVCDLNKYKWNYLEIFAELTLEVKFHALTLFDRN